MINLILFVMFSFGMYVWSKNFFDLFLIKKTNVKMKYNEVEIMNKIKKDSFYFGLFLYVTIIMFGKSNSLVLTFLFITTLLLVLYIEIIYKRLKFKS